MLVNVNDRNVSLIITLTLTAMEDDGNNISILPWFHIGNKPKSPSYDIVVLQPTIVH